MKYHVTYFYLATGMEGIADTKDYGYVVADSPHEAKLAVATRVMPDHVGWMMGCLSAEECR